PADLNVIQGVYPERPKPRENLLPDSEPLYIGGNEGLAIVEHIPEGVDVDYKEGDWVIMGKPQLGTWTSHANISANALFPVPRDASSSLTDIQAATLAINPCTAYRMLKDPVTDLQQGEWILQNGANSQVGLAVIQLAKQWGLKTINFVRDRNDMAGLRTNLESLGADLVYPYSELEDKSFKKRPAEQISSSPMRLALNCVGGPTTTAMAKLLGKDATLVTYGAMSKQPLSLPSSLLIFRGLNSVGFWMTTWYARASRAERMKMSKDLVELMEQGKFKQTECDILDLQGSDRDIARMSNNEISQPRMKKLMLRFVWIMTRHTWMWSHPPQSGWSQ
ncbi:hypothetical protein EMMF5_006554, partial [Cystobasidiomycetes sp. EMM_F5]